MHSYITGLLELARQVRNAWFKLKLTEDVGRAPGTFNRLWSRACLSKGSLGSGAGSICQNLHWASEQDQSVQSSTRLWSRTHLFKGSLGSGAGPVGPKLHRALKQDPSIQRHLLNTRQGPQVLPDHSSRQATWTLCSSTQTSPLGICWFWCAAAWLGRPH